MVVTGFEVAGAVTGALGTLNLILTSIPKLRTQFENYRKAERKLARLERDFRTFRKTFIRFQEEWSIQSTTPTRQMRATWGRASCEDILDQFADIQATCAKFKKIIDKLISTDAADHAQDQAATQDELGDSPGRSDRPRPPRPPSSSSSQEYGEADRTFRDQVASRLSEVTERYLTLPRKLKFVLFSIDDLKQLSADLRKKLRYVREDAMRAYLVKHKEANARENDSVEERRENADTAEALKSAMESRDASEALYEAASGLLMAATSRQRSQPGLELHMSPYQKEGNAGLSYKLTLMWPRRAGEPCDILLSGPLRGTEETGHADIQSTSIPGFIETSHAEQENKSPSVFSAAIRGQTVRFELTKPKHTRHLETCHSTTWNNFLTLDHNNDPPLGSPRKLELAFRIVESAFFLLGTSWLTHLDGAQVHVNNCGRYPRLVLAVHNLAYTDFDYIEPHIFHVGVLLTEISLSTPCQIRKYQRNGTNEYRLRVQHNDHGDIVSETWSPEWVPRHIFEDSDLRNIALYADAVKFCLQQCPQFRNKGWLRPNWQLETWVERRRAYNRFILRDFYKFVYKPLKMLYELDQLQYGSSNESLD